ncbi:MAG TPA: monovalent cation/H(+) antiporter subunit G [Gammaproteobacteria bacterium]|nr:monovalent cation/H(+) antiporter subunit G [Gammaproteobacteria bacterium]
MSFPSLPLWAAAPATALLIIGGLAALVGTAGLLRLPSFYARMHAPTMAATLGTGCVLLASMLVSSALLQRPSLHELLIALFVVITAPIGSMLLMKAGIHRDTMSNSAPKNPLRQGPEA